MPLIDQRDVLKGLTVREAMRRQVIRLPHAASLAQAIRTTIKFKVNALLVEGPSREALGVVSKTDLMSAYYVGLPLETLLEAIMVGPPLFCRAEDSLDAALEIMRTRRVHRLYVEETEPGVAAGVLAYPDIVGVLYRFCHRCRRTLLKRGKAAIAGPDLANQVRVREVMTVGVAGFSEDAGLYAVMEGLAAQRLAAVLIRRKDGMPAGVVSKTDLILAYLHRRPPETVAREIMHVPVQACDQEQTLEAALKQMIFADIHRLFVYQERPAQVVGVLSLSDAARFRSGTCRACLASRIQVGGG
jgi:signal-transduction protein with cAMP-binding, CBS, and nucleotidyltransferase domain